MWSSPWTAPRAEGLDQRAARASFPISSMCQALDDLTVQVTLDGPDGAFLFDMAWGDAVIVDPASADTNATNPIGTGPFRFARWVQGDRVDLERNEAYWGEPASAGDRELPLHLRPQCRLRGADGGRCGCLPRISPRPRRWPSSRADPRFSVIVGSTEGETILAMNNAQAPLDDNPCAAGDQPCDQTGRHHRRGHVRLRHAHRHAFRAASSRLRRSDGELGP